MEYIRLSQCNLVEHINERIPLVFIVKSAEMRSYSKSNGEFMSLVIKDKDIEYEAKIWTVSERMKELIQAGKAYKAQIDIKPYAKGKNGISCIVYSIDIADMEVSEFSDWDENYKDCYEIVNKILGILGDTNYGRICNELITSNWEKFSKWVAGKSMHHTQLGALLTHSASVAKSALIIGQFYNSMYGENFVNLHLLLAGALLHDIGKLKELDVDTSSGVCEYSNDAALLSHTMASMLYIDRAAVKLGIDPDSEEIKLLEHLMGSHHGNAEWGCTISPNTTEATIISHADMIDAEMWRYNRELKEVKGGMSRSSWINGDIRVMYKEILKENK